MPRAHPHGRARIVWPAVVTLTLLAAVIYLLLQRIPGRVEQPLATLAPGSQLGIVRLLGAPQGSGAGRSIAYRLKLTAKDIGRVVSHARIELLTMSDREGLLIKSGEIRVSGTDCVYRAPAGTPFPVNDFLSFARGSDCVPLTGSATGELDVTVSVAEIARLEVLTYQTPVDAPPEHTNLIAGHASDARLLQVVRGRFVDPYPGRTARRIELLNYVWQVSPGRTWIWMVIAGAGVLLLFGNMLFWKSPIEQRGRSRIVRSTAGACIAAALALTYAVLTPPFHAPDEPAHFIGYKMFLGHPDLYVETGNWARAMHFERIQFHALEKFGPFDMDAVGAPWTEGQAPDPRIRGGGAFYLWRAIASPFRSLPAPELLLTLRVVNCAMFALVIAGFILAAQCLTDIPRPHLLAFPLFLLPTLPFFAMHVSNHAPLVCTYIVVSLGVIVWLLDGRRSAAAGFIIGAGWAAGLLLSRSAIPLAPLVLAVLAGRLLLGSRDTTWQSTLLFWSSAALPPIALTVADAEYLRTLAGFGGAAGAGEATRAIIGTAAHPGIVLVALAIVAGTERLLTSARARASDGVRSFATRLGRWSMTLTAIAVFVAVAASTVVRFPTVERIDQAQPPPASEYVWSSLAATLTMFRMGRPDFFTSTSFWGGFGWLETQPDWRFVSALVLPTAASFVALVLWIRRGADAAMAARLLFVVAGFVLSVAAYAYTLVRLLPADFVGRYVYGAYLAMLLICWMPLATVPQSPNGGSRTVSTWIPALACMAVHAYCLSVILRRYF